MKITKQILDAITNAYIEAVYFTDTGDIDQPSSDTPLAQTTREDAWQECTDFVYVCHRAGLLAEYARINGATWDAFGHDFWLTRNGHGVGFWDRGHGDLGNKLSDLARAAGERHAYESAGELFID